MRTHLETVLTLHRAQTAISRRLDAALGNGIGATDLAVLTTLRDAPEQKLRRVDLARAMALTPSGITRLLLPLEKIGLVTRESNPEDARVAFAMLTDAGRTVVDEATVQGELIAAEWLGRLEPSEITQLSEIVKKLAAEVNPGAGVTSGRPPWLQAPPS